MKTFIFLFLLLLPLFSKESIKHTFTLSYKFGTLGGGADFGFAFNKKFATRVNINGFSEFRKIRYNQKDFNLKGTLYNGGLLFDVHPWENAFCLTWGAYYSKNNIFLVHKPKSKKIVIGEHEYPAMQIGRVDTNIHFKHKVNPYLGLGFNSIDKTNKWHFVLDIGAVYINNATAKIKARANSGFKAMQPILDNESKIEEDKLNKKLKKYKFYPVVSLGIGFNF